MLQSGAGPRPVSAAPRMARGSVCAGRGKDAVFAVNDQGEYEKSGALPHRRLWWASQQRTLVFHQPEISASTPFAEAAERDLLHHV